MRIVLFATIASALLMSGCADGGYTVYHPIKGNQQMYADQAQCKSLAMGASANAYAVQDGHNFAENFSGFTQFTNTNGSGMVQELMYKDCMRGFGWTFQ